MADGQGPGRDRGAQDRGQPAQEWYAVDPNPAPGSYPPAQDGAHGSGPYGSGAYGSGAYGSGAYGSGAYGSGAYGSGAYGSGAYGQGSYPPGGNSPGAQPHGGFGPGYGQGPNGWGYAPDYGPAYPPGPGVPGPGNQQPPGSSNANRPGLIVATAVLGYITAGLLLLIALFLLTYASGDGGNGDFFVASDGPRGRLLVAAVANLVSGGLLIAGSVQLCARSMTGRTMYFCGAAIVILSAGFWLTALHGTSEGSGAVFWAALFVTMVVLGCAFTTPAAVRWWLQGTKPRTVGSGP